MNALDSGTRQSCDRTIYILILKQPEGRFTENMILNLIIKQPEDRSTENGIAFYCQQPEGRSTGNSLATS